MGKRVHRNNSDKFYSLRYRMVKAARSTAPVDTGNLKNNGIYSMRTLRGFRVVWDMRFAHYIPYVDKPTKYPTRRGLTPKQRRNQFFVERGLCKLAAIIGRTKAGSKRYLNSNSKAEYYETMPLLYNGKYLNDNSSMTIEKGNQRMASRFSQSVIKAYESGLTLPAIDKFNDLEEMDEVVENFDTFEMFDQSQFQ